VIRVRLLWGSPTHGIVLEGTDEALTDIANRLYDFAARHKTDVESQNVMDLAVRMIVVLAGRTN
jgi:hypothetical protein